MKIIPTVFSHNKNEFDKRYANVSRLSKEIQVDFMDGKFVKARSVLVSSIQNLKSKNKVFEAHLMTENPEKYLSLLKKKGFSRVIFHLSSTRNPEEVYKEIKKHKMKPVIAFNPGISLIRIMKIIKKTRARHILLMGVVPGKEGQQLKKNILKKAKKIKQKYPRMRIQVDGGVNPDNIKLLRDSGVEIINIGSFLGNSRNPREKLNELKKAL